jgi:hypothetical protein
MCAITNDLLDLEKLRSGKFVMRPTTVGLLEIMESVSSAARPACTGTLGVSMDSDVPATLFTDGQRLRQILANGLSNACKQAENVMLVVSATPAAPGGGGGSVLLRVLDDGPGLRGVDVSKLFEDFAAGTDVVGVRGEGVKGSGLGLPICGRFAKLMGGTLTVRDRPDGFTGAEFALTLPWGAAALPGVIAAGASAARGASGGKGKKKVGKYGPSAVTPEEASVHVPADPPRTPSLLDAQPQQQRSGSPLTGGGGGGGGGGRAPHLLLLLGAEAAGASGGRRPRIVVVDDAPLNRRIADRYIRSLGCEGVLLTDGDEVAPAIARAPCDLILMDIKMARMDGDVACRQLRAGGYTGPIIAVRACARVCVCMLGGGAERLFTCAPVL